MHGAVACNCRVECEMSGRGNWWVQSIKTPSPGNSACAKIGSRAEASPASSQFNYVTVHVEMSAKNIFELALNYESTMLWVPM